MAVSGQHADVATGYRGAGATAARSSC